MATGDSTDLEWLAALARLGPVDLKRVSRLVDALILATPAAATRARELLDEPLPDFTHEAARQRIEDVLSFLAGQRGRGGAA